MKMTVMVTFTAFEAIRRGTLLFYFAVATLIIAIFAIWLRQSPDDPAMIVMFGTSLPGSINGISSANFFMLMLLRQSTFWIILLGTFGSVGLMTSFVERGIIELYLSKPLERWKLFVGRALGASGGVVVNLLFCIVGIWAVFGVKIGFWEWRFLVAGFLVAYAFLCYFSVLSFLALWSRNTVLTIMLGLLFAFVSMILESRGQGLYLLWDNSIFHRVVDIFYYATPQLDAMLSNASILVAGIPLALNQPTFTITPFLYSLGAAGLFYGLSIYIFTKRDF